MTNNKLVNQTDLLSNHNPSPQNIANINHNNSIKNNAPNVRAKYSGISKAKIYAAQNERLWKYDSNPTDPNNKQNLFNENEVLDDSKPVFAEIINQKFLANENIAKDQNPFIHEQKYQPKQKKAKGLGIVSNPLIPQDNPDN